jgi:uridine phosphorylase
LTEKQIQNHIKLDEVDRICLLSGNPDRVPKIAEHLTGAQEVANYRGLVAYKGKTPNKNTPVTVLTTGMGAPSNAIVMEEAYKAGGRIFIRIGSCGALQDSHPLGTIFIPHGAIRDEQTSRQLIPLEFPAVADPELFQLLKETAIELQEDVPTGLVHTTDIYYTDDPLKWKKYNVVCVEMESGFLFSLHGLKPDIRVASILTADGNLNDSQSIYNGNTEKRLQFFRGKVKKSIEITIKAIEKINF